MESKPAAAREGEDAGQRQRQEGGVAAARGQDRQQAREALRHPFRLRVCHRRRVRLLSGRTAQGSVPRKEGWQVEHGRGIKHC